MRSSRRRRTGRRTRLRRSRRRRRLSGLDVPSLEPHAAPLSYIQPGATVSESADTNAANTLGGSGSLTSISRALASMTLQRLWSHFDLAADYIGGVAYYDLPGQGFKALQQMDFEQKISWKRGQFAVRDSFSYLPEGNFGGSVWIAGVAGNRVAGEHVVFVLLRRRQPGDVGTCPAGNEHRVGRCVGVSLARSRPSPRLAVTRSRISTGTMGLEARSLEPRRPPPR